MTEVTPSAALLDRFRSASSVFVLTGAGISAESGVPTFRGGGNAAVWNGMPFDIISSAMMVEQDLPLVWEWFDYRRSIVESALPNPAHYELARWQSTFTECTITTQNIDGLHQRAGAKEVIELHGSMWRARCMTCHSRWDIPNTGRPDTCFECGDPLRPDVVLFGEMLPPGAFERAAMMASQAELCFVIGTSALVYPAASLPEIARESGSYLCEVNPEETPLSSLCDEVLKGKAGDILPMFNSERS